MSSEELEAIININGPEYENSDDLPVPEGYDDPYASGDDHGGVTSDWFFLPLTNN